MTEFRMHLGFHKTASTHIQRILDHNHHQLRKTGTFSILHKRLRNKYTRVTETFANQQIGMDFGDPITADEFEAATKAFWEKVPFDRFDRVILSEENVAGHVGQCVYPGLLYRFPKTYMRYFAMALPKPPTQIDVVVRSYDTFFASCYLEYLSSTAAHRYITVDEMMVKVMNNAPSWKDTLGFLGQVFDSAQITVWRYEDLRKTMPELMRGLAGIDANALEDPPADEGGSRVSPSKGALVRFENVLAKHGVEVALARWKDVKVEAAADPKTSFDPWRPADKAHLRRLYEQDLNDIRDDPRFIVKSAA